MSDDSNRARKQVFEAPDALAEDPQEYDEPLAPCHRVKKEPPHRDSAARRPVLMTLTKDEYEAAERKRPIPSPPKPRQAFGGEVFVPQGTTGRAVRSAGGKSHADGDVCGDCGLTYGEHLVGPADGSYRREACRVFVPIDDSDPVNEIPDELPLIVRRGPSAQ